MEDAFLVEALELQLLRTLHSKHCQLVEFIRHFLEKASEDIFEKRLSIPHILQLSEEISQVHVLRIALLFLLILKKDHGVDIGLADLNTESFLDFFLEEFLHLLYLVLQTMTILFYQHTIPQILLASVVRILFTEVVLPAVLSALRVLILLLLVIVLIVVTPIVVVEVSISFSATTIVSALISFFLFWFVCERESGGVPDGLRGNISFFCFFDLFFGVHHILH